MTRKTHYIIGILIILFASSCEKTKYKSKIIQSYRVENDKAGNSLKISNLKVLEIKEVGPEYGDTLIVNHYLKRRKVNFQIIKNTRNTIALLDSNIIKYQKLLKIGRKADIPKYEVGLKDTELRLTKQKRFLIEMQEKINDDDKKIIQARSRSYSNNQSKFKKVEYLIVASTDSIQLNDTLSIVFDEKMKWSFVKNDLYCNYLGK